MSVMIIWSTKLHYVSIKQICITKKLYTLVLNDLQMCLFFSCTRIGKHYPRVESHHDNNCNILLPIYVSKQNILISLYFLTNILIVNKYIHFESLKIMHQQVKKEDKMDCLLFICILYVIKYQRIDV